MKRIKYLSSFIICFFVIGSISTGSMAQKASGTKMRQALTDFQYKISGPYTHDNLSVYLIHGPNRISGNGYLLLQEALTRRVVIVHETGDVNQLILENVSENIVYIQSGDIVKGGKQDRTISYDILLPPYSGKRSVMVFCVEHGRWHARGSESASSFDASEQQLVSKDLKVEAKRNNSQTGVWKNVDSVQTKLAENTGAAVRSSQSESSLQLTLENKKVQEISNQYIRRLMPVVTGKGDVIGYAFSINGVINSADVYASHTLFLKLWPKLIKASSIEALVELQKERSYQPPSIQAVQNWIADAASGKSSQKSITSGTTLVMNESDKDLFFETRAGVHKESWIHRNYIKK